MKDRNDLSLLIDIDSAECVFSEVKNIIALIHADYDFCVLDHVFADVVRLYNGEYHGYRRCNTEYHNLRHTTDVLLTMARLLHGFFIEGHVLSSKMMDLGFLSALMHDTGYIQTEDDCEGTGSKYTKIHVERSIQFMRNYFIKNNLPMDDYEKCSRIVAATHQSKKLCDIPFESEEEILIGKLIYTAEFLGQMADRYYLEKLLFLYKEFAEGNVPGIKHEGDLLEKTIDFFEIIRQRLETEMGYKAVYMRHHFKSRWNIDCDLYTASIMKNITYLKYVLECCRQNYRDMLKRGDIVKNLGQQVLMNA